MTIPGPGQFERLARNIQEVVADLPDAFSQVHEAAYTATITTDPLGKVRVFGSDATADLATNEWADRLRSDLSNANRYLTIAAKATMDARRALRRGVVMSRPLIAARKVTAWSEEDVAAAEDRARSRRRDEARAAPQISFPPRTDR